ncbi:MAG: VOC family protein [Sphingorhabdus sp.]
MMLARAVMTAVLAGLLLVSCKPVAKEEKPKVVHPVYYFEIPVIDMDRAVNFYEKLLGTKLERETVDGYEMARFSFAEGTPGATGALAKGDVYKPSKDGAIVYFHVDDIKATVARAEAMGRPVLYPVKDIGEAGFVAEIEDSEGNRLALSQLPNEK